jgi:FixJ family two-component response regulator
MGNAKPFVAVVDDDESVGRAVKRLLRSAGIGSDTFSDGEAFLDKVASTPSYRPDCAVVDIQMPRVNGFEVQRRLAGTGIPVILISAHEDAGVREHGLACGAVGYLRKPFNDSLFIRAVQNALGMTSVR